MKRNRTTQRREASIDEQLKSHIAAIHKLVANDDPSIKSWGDELAREEAKIVDEGTGLGLTENEDQNALAMDNWPTDADNMKMVASSKRELIAKRLIKMATILLKED